MPLLVKDRVLLRAFRRGESWALEEVFDYYSPKLKRYLQSGFSFTSQGKICRFGGSATGAELDWVVQETFAARKADRQRVADLQAQLDALQPPQRGAE